MTTERRRLPVLRLLPFLLLSAALLLPPNAARVAQADPSAPGLGPGSSRRASKESKPAPSARTAPEKRAPGVTKKGGLIVISKEFAQEVRENSTILLSKVAIKARLDEGGRLRGYEAVQIDAGSVVERTAGTCDGAADTPQRRQKLSSASSPKSHAEQVDICMRRHRSV